jgi:hypothetical protein
MDASYSGTNSESKQRISDFRKTWKIMSGGVFLCFVSFSKKEMKKIKIQTIRLL